MPNREKFFHTMETFGCRRWVQGVAVVSPAEFAPATEGGPTIGPSLQPKNVATE